MTSAISYSDINSEYPIPGKDNDSQGFRTNFSLIKSGLETASDEISLLQAGKADLITANYFANATPSTTTGTGAVVIAGGVGIAQDLNVGGNITFAGGGNALSTSTLAPSMLPGGDVTFYGTYGEPTFNTSYTLLGNKFFPRTISVGRENQDTAINLVYGATTASSQVIIHSSVQNAGGVGIRLVGPSSGSFIKFARRAVGNPAETELSTITHDGTNLTVSGPVKFLGTVIIPTANPASTDPGEPGQVAQGNGYFYVCTGTNTWSRIQLTATGF